MATLLLLPCVSGCANLVPLAQQLATGAGASASTTAAAPTTSADSETSGGDVRGGADSSTSSKQSNANGEEGDDLAEDPKYYSACTFQRRGQNGLPEGEKKPVSEAGSDDYPVMKLLGISLTVPGDMFVYIQFMPPITNSQETRFTIYPNQERAEFLQIQVARDKVIGATYGRGDPNDMSNREASNRKAYFAKDLPGSDPRYSSNDVILTRIEKKHARPYKLESVLTMETDKTISECAYNPDDPRNKAS